MITPTQMRAARAMLDVSQGVVAGHLGIAANTLSKIESGQSDISMSRLNEIQRYYEREGIAFGENESVAFQSNGVETYKGKDGFWAFMNDVYNEVQSGGEIFVNNVREQDFMKWIGSNVPVHVERMTKIEGLDFKILIEEGDINKIASSYAEYRMLPPGKFGTLPLYLYGDKTGLIIFDEDNVTAFVIQHKAVCQYFRSRFIALWNNIESQS